MTHVVDRRRSDSFSQRLLRGYGRVGFLPTVLIVLVVAMALFVPRFLSVQNVFNVLRSSSYLVILSAGQMLVLIVGGFDLSVGAVVPLASVVSAMTMVWAAGALPGQSGLVIALGVLAGLGSGLVVGLLNGLSVAFLKVSAFIVTLGSMSIATGVALLLTNGIPVYGMPKAYVDGFGRGLWFQLPTAVYLAALVVAGVWFIQNFTRMGRYLYAIGGNLHAATVSGVRTKTYLVLAYAVCSILAAVTGLALTAQIGSGQAVINGQLTLESIAAAVIAGVSLKGGVGRVEMVALAALFLLILTNAMDLLRIDPRIQTIFLGLIVVLAVAIEELAKRRTPVD